MKFERRDILGKKRVDLVTLSDGSIEWPSFMRGSVNFMLLTP